MKNRIKLLTFSLLLTLASTSVCYAATTWEYLVKTYPLIGNDDALTRQMNSLGQEAWELINCTEGSGKITCVFKRPAKTQ